MCKFAIKITITEINGNNTPYLWHHIEAAARE